MHIGNDESDIFLLSQISQGKEEAFDFIFRKYYKVLVIQAVKFVHDQDTAQSLVQNCFVKYWEKRHELHINESLSSYLFFMVRNQCIDYLRDKQHKNLVPLTQQTDFPENETEDEIDASDLSSHLWHAITNLPERCRIAFEYSRIDGLTYSQIAVKMGITQKAVEALISRGLKLLRVNLVDFLGILIGIILSIIFI